MVEEGREEMRRDRGHGGLPGEEDSMVGGGCWSRERLVGDGEVGTAALMVRSCGLRGDCCISTDDQTSGKASMIFK